jgi:hypothetical protein
MERMAVKGDNGQQNSNVIIHANVANDIDIYRLARQVSDEIRKRR